MAQKLTAEQQKQMDSLKAVAAQLRAQPNRGPGAWTISDEQIQAVLQAHWAGIGHELVYDGDYVETMFGTMVPVDINKDE